MSEWEKEKLRQSTLYIEREPDDNDLDKYYEYYVEEKKKKHKKRLDMDLDDVMALIFVIILVVGFILIVIGQLCGFQTLSVIGLMLIFANIVMGGLYFA